MKPVYRVRDWAGNFENHESRKLRHLRFVYLPNRQDGKGYRRLAAHPRATEVFAAWVLILQVASKMNERGLLVDEDGPLDALDLGAMTGFPTSIFEVAFEVLTDPKIAWLEVVNPPENKPKSPDSESESPENHQNNGKVRDDLPENTPNFGLEGKGREGKGSIVAETAAKPPLGPAPAVLEFPCEGGKTWELTEAKAAEYRQTFPLVNVDAEVRKATQWLRDNPNKRKTPRGMPAFLGRWMGRASADAESREKAAPGNEPTFGGGFRKPTEEDLAVAFADDAAEVLP